MRESGKGRVVEVCSELDDEPTAELSHLQSRSRLQFIAFCFYNLVYMFSLPVVALLWHLVTTEWHLVEKQKLSWHLTIFLNFYMNSLSL